MAVPPAVAASWPEFEAPPTHDFLDKRAAKFSKRPLHSRDWREIWTCSCGKVHHPTKNVFINLPVYCCPCGKVNPAVVNWKLTDIKYNKADLNFMVYNQRSSNYCSFYAAAAVVDCSRRIRAAMMGGRGNSLQLDVLELVAQCEAELGFVWGTMPRHMCFEWRDNLPFVLRTLKSCGITFVAGKGLFD